MTKPYNDDQSAHRTEKRESVWSMRDAEKKRLKKFDFAEMKAAALSDEPEVRKAAFIEYFERFAEFPSYLFENGDSIDKKFLETILDIEKDPEMKQPILQGIAALRVRLSF